MKLEVIVQLELPDKEHCDPLCPLMVGDRCYLGKRDETVLTLKADVKGYIRTDRCIKYE
jgi:hypothetical protein